MRVVAELLFNTWHADEDERDVGAVVLVAKVFEGVCGEAFGLIDDDEFDEVSPGRSSGVVENLPAAGEVFFDASLGANDDPIEFLFEGFLGGGDVGCVEHGAGSVRGGVDLLVGVVAEAPPVDEWADAVPVCVAARGKGFADSGGTEADPDGALLFHGVGEFGEAAVFFGDDEGFGHGKSSS